MKSSKPTLERITNNFGSSFAFRHYNQPCEGNLKFWHFHPEIEMAYIKNGNGKRHIGNHLSYFQNGDLVLIGSNVPHSGFSDRLSGNQEEIVIQMLPEFLGPNFFNTPEMQPIAQLINRANLGISFYGRTRKQVGLLLESMILKNPFDRLVDLISILNELAFSKEFKLLNAEKVVLEISPREQERMTTIFQFVQENFTRTITLQEISEKVNLTEPSFSRYFKEITGKTFTHFVNEYRIVHASKLLAEGSMSIEEVCFECGFNNFSHFTKRFKLITGKTPKHYRDELKQILQ
ncbi:MAG: helix-turn-helix domain-containing protein [Saprospiraceae bacterium]|nr:helix-turn-helix domain-containing protein [Saprospiraceae bacterium]